MKKRKLLAAGGAAAAGAPPGGETFRLAQRLLPTDLSDSVYSFLLPRDFGLLWATAKPLAASVFQFVQRGGVRTMHLSDQASFLNPREFIWRYLGWMSSGQAPPQRVQRIVLPGDRQCRHPNLGNTTAGQILHRIAQVIRHNNTSLRVVEDGQDGTSRVFSHVDAHMAFLFLKALAHCTNLVRLLIPTTMRDQEATVVPMDEGKSVSFDMPEMMKQISSSNSRHLTHIVIQDTVDLGTQDLRNMLGNFKHMHCFAWHGGSSVEEVATVLTWAAQHTSLRHLTLGLTIFDEADGQMLEGDVDALVVLRRLLLDAQHLVVFELSLRAPDSLDSSAPPNLDALQPASMPNLKELRITDEGYCRNMYGLQHPPTADEEEDDEEDDEKMTEEEKKASETRVREFRISLLAKIQFPNLERLTLPGGLAHVACVLDQTPRLKSLRILKKMCGCDRREEWDEEAFVFWLIRHQFPLPPLEKFVVAGDAPLSCHVLHHVALAFGRSLRILDIDEMDEEAYTSLSTTIRWVLRDCPKLELLHLGMGFPSDADEKGFHGEAVMPRAEWKRGELVHTCLQVLDVPILDTWMLDQVQLPALQRMELAFHMPAPVAFLTTLPKPLPELVLHDIQHPEDLVKAVPVGRRLRVTKVVVTESLIVEDDFVVQLQAMCDARDLRRIVANGVDYL